MSQAGTATIEATPTYAGHRPDTELYAADFVLSTCAEITAELLPDAGAATWTSAPSGIAIALSIPAGDHVAIAVRIGHYASGCADVSPLVPNATSAVPVQVYDVPMALSLTNLNATFSFAPDATPTSGVAGGGRRRRSRGSRGRSSRRGAQRRRPRAPRRDARGDRGARRIRRSSTSSGQAERVGRHRDELDVRARAVDREPRGDLAHRRGGPGDRRRSVPHIGNGTSGGDGAGDRGVVRPARLASRAGVAQPTPFQWTADANDTIHLSGAIDLASTPLFAHEADAQAAASVTSATDVPSAIAVGIDCAGLATSLVGSGVSYGTCGARARRTCAAAALDARRGRARRVAGGGRRRSRPHDDHRERPGGRRRPRRAGVRARGVAGERLGPRGAGASRDRRRWRSRGRSSRPSRSCRLPAVERRFGELTRIVRRLTTWKSGLSGSFAQIDSSYSPGFCPCPRGTSIANRSPFTVTGSGVTYPCGQNIWYGCGTEYVRRPFAVAAVIGCGAVDPREPDADRASRADDLRPAT